MPVDLLRACYETQMRLFEDSDDTVTVRWFFTAKDAKFYPGYTKYASGNWASDRLSWPGVGEVLGAPRKFVDGSRPPGADGQRFCGDPAKIASGFSVNDPRFCNNLDGLAGACWFPRPWWCCEFEPGDFPPTFKFHVVRILEKSTQTLVNEGDELLFTQDPFDHTRYNCATKFFDLLSPYAFTYCQAWCGGPFGMDLMFFLVQGEDNLAERQLPHPFGGVFPPFNPFQTGQWGVENGKEVWVDCYFGVPPPERSTGVITIWTGEWIPTNYLPDGFH